MKAPFPKGKILIQFDGLCILCSRAIQFILKADRHKLFLFQTLQGVKGNNETADSIIVKSDNHIYTHLEAIMKIGQELGGIYRLIEIFRLLPAKWRHRLYLWVAQNRYHWFGIRDSCYLPTQEESERFI